MRARWFSKRALILHLSLVIWTPGCLAAGWWQATRALDGNTLSYLYSVEWPAFAIVGVIGWWQLIHTDFENVGAKAQRKAALAAAAAGEIVEEDKRRREEEDPDLAAYNDYLNTLAQRPQAKTWRPQ